MSAISKQSEQEERKKEEQLENQKKFTEALNTYFKLKNTYESNIQKEKTQISKIPELSWREKRIEFMKFKPKCVNCNRPVGTVFSTKTNAETGERQYVALCGDRKDPCPLNININLGVISDITEDLQRDEDTINKYKRDIIIDKNDLLFGYITPEEAVAQFDRIKNEVTDTTTLYEFTLQKYLDIVDNTKEKEELKKLQLEFYNNLDNFNAIIKQYNANQNVQLIVDAVDLYVKIMEPRANEIIKKKYSVNMVEYNENDNTFHLVQQQISIEDLETDIGEIGQKVVSMKMGLDKFASKKKTVKNVKAITSAIPDIKSKESNIDFTKLKTSTLKLKPKPKLVLQEEEPSEEEPSDEESLDGIPSRLM